MKKKYYKKAKQLLFDRAEALQLKRGPMRQILYGKMWLKFECMFFKKNYREELLIEAIQFAILRRFRVDLNGLFKNHNFHIEEMIYLERYNWNKLSASELVLGIQIAHKQLNTDKGMSLYLLEAIERLEK